MNVTFGLRFKLLSLGAAVALAISSPAARAALTHRYSFAADANDSVGTAHGTLRGPATASGGNLQLNNPNFSPSTFAGGYLSLPTSILPSSGSVTIEQWFNFTGSGFFARAWTFTNHNNDFVNPPSNPPSQTNGQYLEHIISNPLPSPGAGGSRVTQALSGFGGSATPPPGPETHAYHTTDGLGVDGDGYLDHGIPYMTATVINADAGTLSYYLFRVSDGVGGLQQSIPAIPLSSYSFTNAYIGRSPYLADNWTSGAVDEFRIYTDARSSAQILADFQAGPNQLVPEPTAVTLVGASLAGLLIAARRRR